MAVSHSVVSWIQVGGLIIGLYGFFFLSISIFGDTSARWFAALLPALASGLGALLYTSAYSPSSEPAVSIPPSWVAWLVTLLSFAYGYWIGLPPKNPTPRNVLDNKLHKFIVVSKHVFVIWTIGVAVCGLLLAGALLIARHLQGKSLTQHESFDAIAFGGAILYMAALVSEYWLPRMLKGGRLLKLGFFLSTIAILTQFLPPVLDLLGIAVK